jgi:hypothetical protein
MNGTPPSQPAGRQADTATRGSAKKSSEGRLAQLVASKGPWFKGLPDTATILNTCLLCTLAVDGLATFALAVGDLNYAVAIYDSLGVAILFAIAGANFLAIGFVLYGVASWDAAAFIAQAFVLGLAIYIMVVDYYKSAKTNWYVMAIAAVVGLVAFAWLLVLVRPALKRFSRFTKTAAILTALVPLAGAAQFYLQSYYIPHTSEPLVDVSAELSPQSKTPQSETPPRIHLSAKVTVHNRGSARVDVAAALMRVTAYPPHQPPPHQPPPQQPPPQTPPQQPLPQQPLPQQTPPQQATPQQQPPEAAFGCRASDRGATWCQIADGLDLSGRNEDTDYRYYPARAVNAQLLYAGLFMPGDSYLLPGETDVFQKEVDIDPADVGLARLSVSALFLTDRNIKDHTSCWQTRASSVTDPTSFSIEVNMPKRNSDQWTLPIFDRRMRINYFCMDSEFAPQNIVDRWIGNQGVLRVSIILNDPQRPGLEYPRFSYLYCLVDADGYRLDDDDGSIAKRLEKRNPAGGIELSAEYAPGDPIKTDAKG